MRFCVMIEGILVCRQFQISQCTTNFKLVHFCVFPAFSHFSIIAKFKTGSFSVALFGLPCKLCKFNNIGSLTGTLPVTNLSVQNDLNCSSPNFDILELSSYTISLKVDFLLLSIVNLFNLNGFVRNDVFSLEISSENCFWKALLSLWCFKGSKSNYTLGMLS